MRRLATLTHGDVSVPAEPSLQLHRLAVRGVVRRGPAVLLVETSGGDLKLPGGGVEPGESEEDAVRREVAEECGLTVLDVTGVLGEVVEHAAAKEAEYAVFTMTSRYFTCTVAAEPGEQRLDDYERQLGLAPVWVDVRAAVERLRAAGPDAAPWTRRELLILEMLAAAHP